MGQNVSKQLKCVHILMKPKNIALKQISTILFAIIHNAWPDED